MYDINNDGKLDLNEFLNFINGNTLDLKNSDHLKRLFRVFDQQNSGFISESDLKKVLESIGKKFSDKEIQLAMKIADKNGDGKINYDGK